MLFYTNLPRIKILTKLNIFMDENKPFLYESIFFHDKRGTLIKNFSNESAFDTNNSKDSYISISKKNVFRGLHYQKEPFSQEKFFTVVRGEINLFCLRIKNPKEYYSYNMIPEKKISLFVPKGWATGFHSLSEESIIFYSSNQKYNPENQISINYKIIPELKDKNLIVSNNDK